jgi:hypothetical protein
VLQFRGTLAAFNGDLGASRLLRKGECQDLRAIHYQGPSSYGPPGTPMVSDTDHGPMQVTARATKWLGIEETASKNIYQNKLRLIPSFLPCTS